jgi:glycosyltransferase involved in cell wall biosynthesis
MKKVSIVIPTYYEQDNVMPLTQAVIQQMEALSQYDYEILFIDNDSHDQTREHIRSLCANNAKIKAIFNSKNFGGFNSPIYGLFQSSGDCAILMCADFQDPISMLPKFLKEWENGHPVVCGIKTASKENHIMRFIRSCYYSMIKKFSSVEQIEHFTGFGLYDRSFLDFVEGLHDPAPFLRGIVAEYAPNRKDIPYTQEKRRAGKTSTNFYRLYDAAMLSFTSYTKIGLRVATFLGFGCAVISLFIALIYLILKLIYWNSFPMGMAPALIGVFLFGSLQLFFIGLLGEYILNINTRIMNRPLVLEAERLNFPKRYDSSQRSDGI